MAPVSWSVEFKPSFTGSENMYLYAKDTYEAVAGWTQKGTWTIK